MKEYEMTDLGSMKYFLGIQVQQSEKKDFYVLRKVCRKSLEKVQYVELQANGYSNGN